MKQNQHCNELTQRMKVVKFYFKNEFYYVRFLRATAQSTKQGERKLTTTTS